MSKPAKTFCDGVVKMDAIEAKLALGQKLTKSELSFTVGFFKGCAMSGKTADELQKDIDAARDENASTQTFPA